MTKRIPALLTLPQTGNLQPSLVRRDAEIANALNQAIDEIATLGGGGVSDGDKGDITVSSSGTVWSLDAGTVGITELSATGTPSDSTFLRGDNTWAAASGSVADGDKGDITVSASGTTWTVDGKDAASGFAMLNASSRITKGVDTTDDVIIDLATKGLVLKDTQGTPHYWRLTIDNSGALVTSDLGTTKP